MDVTVPSGTVTFLFTDVEGSTRLWQDHSKAMGVALARHDQILQRSIERHGGYVFSTAGDAFAAAFGSADSAVRSAVEIQRSLAAEEWGEVTIQVRIGLHTGAAEERDGDYFGPVVNRSARIMSLASGGQVLLSSITEELIREGADLDVDRRDVGEHQLKSLSEPQHLFQLMGSGLSSDVLTPGATVGLGNLPHGVADFVGRVDDLSQLADLVARGRVLTLTGVGGAGKTQLSVKVAAQLAPEFPDGAWWCDLTPTSGPELVPNAVASALGLSLQPGIDPATSVADALARRELLVVLDNCEHVVPGVVRVLDEVMAGCPGVAVIATSRQPIGSRDESVWPIRPLDPTSEAVELLIRRATAADATVDADAWDRNELGELCSRLDGIPLAIEMAAARLRSMAPRQVIDRLEDRFRMLKSRHSDGVDRHHTLLATLDWSYELLEPDEQLLLDRLGVFADAFDLEVAQLVCADERLDDYDVIDGLAGLVDKSMVTTVRGRTRMRYRLLETVREYGLEHLDARGETDAIRSRHMTAHLDIAEAAGERILDDRFWSGLAAYDENWNDILAALEWATAIADVEVVTRLIRASTLYAMPFGRSELATLALVAAELPDAPAVAHAILAFFADGLEQIEHAERGFEIGTENTADLMFLASQLAAGRATTGSGGTLDAIRRAAEYADQSGMPLQMAYWQSILAESLVGWMPAEAAVHAGSARSLLIGMRDHPDAGGTLGRLAGYEARLGNFDEALALCDEGTQVAGDAGFVVWRAYTVALSARIAAALGRSDAPARLRIAIDEARACRAGGSTSGPCSRPPVVGSRPPDSWVRPRWSTATSNAAVGVVPDTTSSRRRTSTIRATPTSDESVPRCHPTTSSTICSKSSPSPTVEDGSDRSNAARSGGLGRLRVQRASWFRDRSCGSGVISVWPTTLHCWRPAPTAPRSCRSSWSTRRLPRPARRGWRISTTVCARSTRRSVSEAARAW